MASVAVSRDRISVLVAAKTCSVGSVSSHCFRRKVRCQDTVSFPRATPSSTGSMRAQICTPHWDERLGFARSQNAYRKQTGVKNQTLGHAVVQDDVELGRKATVDVRHNDCKSKCTRAGMTSVAKLITNDTCERWKVRASGVLKGNIG
jgi:hypothetical protein